MSLEISYILKIPTNEFFSGKQPGTVYVERAESVVGKAWMRSGRRVRFNPPSSQE